MKLAEALLQRKTMLRDIHEGWKALEHAALRKEDEDRKGEDKPEDLLRQQVLRINDLAKLITAINKTNNATILPNGMTMMEAIALRDALTKLVPEENKEPKEDDDDQSWMAIRRGTVVADLDLGLINHERDIAAKNIRELNVMIQAANWTTELLEH